MLRIAREAIKKIGYRDATFHTDRAPEITPPEKSGTNYIARYRLKWTDTGNRIRGSPGIAPVLLDMEVDASSGRIQMLSFAGANTYRPAPKIAVTPQVLQKSNDLSGGIQTAPANPEFARALLTAIMPQLSDFAEKIQLSVTLPLSTNQLDFSRYSCRILDGQPIAQIYLTNGDRFNYQHGRVAAFYAHDAYRKFPDEGRIEDFLGKINMTTNQAIALCERTIKSLGYKETLPQAWFGGSAYIGDREFSRYVFYWRKPGLMTDFASIEVDVEAKKIKSLFLDDPSLSREPPKIDVPMEK